MMDPMLGTGFVVDQFREHPEFVRVEWTDERPSRGYGLPGNKTVELKTCHVDELRVVDVIDEVSP